jgi:hypothetical protein
MVFSLPTFSEFGAASGTLFESLSHRRVRLRTSLARIRDDAPAGSRGERRFGRSNLSFQNQPLLLRTSARRSTLHFEFSFSNSGVAAASRAALQGGVNVA